MRTGPERDGGAARKQPLHGEDLPARSLAGYVMISVTWTVAV